MHMALVDLWKKLLHSFLCVFFQLTIWEDSGKHAMPLQKHAYCCRLVTSMSVFLRYMWLPVLLNQDGSGNWGPSNLENNISWDVPSKIIKTLISAPGWRNLSFVYRSWPPTFNGLVIVETTLEDDLLILQHGDFHCHDWREIACFAIRQLCAIFNIANLWVYPPPNNGQSKKWKSINLTVGSEIRPSSQFRLTNFIFEWSLSPFARAFYGLRLLRKRSPLSSGKSRLAKYYILARSDIGIYLCIQ